MIQMLLLPRLIMEMFTYGMLQVEAVVLSFIGELVVLMELLSDQSLLLPLPLVSTLNLLSSLLLA